MDVTCTTGDIRGRFPLKTGTVIAGITLAPARSGRSVYVGAGDHYTEQCFQRTVSDKTSQQESRYNLDKHFLLFYLHYPLVWYQMSQGGIIILTIILMNTWVRSVQYHMSNLTIGYRQMTWLSKYRQSQCKEQERRSVVQIKHVSIIDRTSMGTRYPVYQI